MRRSARSSPRTSSPRERRPGDSIARQYGVRPEELEPFSDLVLGRCPVRQSSDCALDDLKRGFENVEVVVVCQCSGNRRGLSDPHVPGVEWGYGAMGNARWKGVRLRDVLNKSGVKKEAIEIAFDGVQSSPRYPAGMALRFARVLRYRDDKAADEADTIATVQALAPRG